MNPSLQIAPKFGYIGMFENSGRVTAASTQSEPDDCLESPPPKSLFDVGINTELDLFVNKDDLPFLPASLQPEKGNGVKIGIRTMQDGTIRAARLAEYNGPDLLFTHKPDEKAPTCPKERFLPTNPYEWENFANRLFMAALHNPHAGDYSGILFANDEGPMELGMPGHHERQGFRAMAMACAMHMKCIIERSP